MGPTSPPLVYAVLGSPIRHSRSPAMHEAAFAELGLAARYVALEVTPRALRDAVAGLRALGLAGASITVPHKEAIVPLLDELLPSARAAGAVNAVKRQGDRLLGANTDAAGLARALAGDGVPLAGAAVLVLGAGGAARAAAVAAVQASAREVIVAARRLEQAQALCAALRGGLDASGGVLTPAGLDATLPGAFARADVVVQATSATLGGGPEAHAFAASLPIDALPTHAVLVDVVYEPEVTAFLAAGARRGLRTLGGLAMLVEQGALAFEWWTGQEAPRAVMRRAVSRV